VRSADAESREQRNVALAQGMVLREQQLEGPDSRLPQLERRGQRRFTGARTFDVFDHDRISAAQRSFRRRARRSEGRLGSVRAEGGDELERLPGVASPEEAGLGARCFGSESGHLLVGARLVRPGRQGIAREAEQNLGVGTAPGHVVGSERADRQRGLGGGKPRKPALAVIERQPAPHELQTPPQPAVDVNGDQYDESGARPLGRTAHRLGQALEVRLFRFRDIFHPQT
jgi:hypothetical protein